jgi:hypothetical protein
MQRALLHCSRPTLSLQQHGTVRQRSAITATNDSYNRQLQPLRTALLLRKALRYSSHRSEASTRQ